MAKKTVVFQVLKESTVQEVLAGRNGKISTVAIGKEEFTTVHQDCVPGKIILVGS